MGRGRDVRLGFDRRRRFGFRLFSLFCRAAFNFEAHEFGTNSDLFADFTVERHDLSGAGGRDFHRCLVCHDGGEKIVFANDIAKLHMPFDKLGLGNAFADIGEFNRKQSHLISPQASIIDVKARPTRSGPGK